jgi:hypothetical protein
MTDTKELIQILVSFVAIGSFIFGVLQYRQAQRWKRLEYAANQLQRIQLDPDLALATMFLDSSKRSVSLPQKYRDYTGTPTFSHDCQALYKTMATQYGNTPEYLIYNEVFEYLFSYLVQIYAFIEMKLINASDVKSLGWILEDLANPQWTNDERVFIGRISLDFSDILLLMDIFGIEHAGRMSEDQVLAMDKEYDEMMVKQRSDQ